MANPAFSKRDCKGNTFFEFSKIFNQKIDKFCDSDEL